MSVYFDYLVHTRHEEFLRDAEIHRLRRAARTNRRTRTRTRAGA
jgi:hypothetical protein